MDNMVDKPRIASKRIDCKRLLSLEVRVRNSLFRQRKRRVMSLAEHQFLGRSSRLDNANFSRSSSSLGFINALVRRDAGQGSCPHWQSKALGLGGENGFTPASCVPRTCRRKISFPILGRFCRRSSLLLAAGPVTAVNDAAHPDLDASGEAGPAASSQPLVRAELTLQPVAPSRESITVARKLESSRLVSEALAAERSGHWQVAVARYEQALVLCPSEGKVWMLLARGWERQRHFDQARNTLRRGIQSNPGNPFLIQALADLEKLLRNWERARKLFAQTLEVEPKFLSAYNSWAMMEDELGNVQRAYELLVRGLRLDPSSTRLLRSLAVLEDKYGRSKFARNLLDKALENEHENVHLLHAVGVLEFKQGNPAKARASFLKAISADPSFMQAYLSLAQMEEYLGNISAARQAYIKGLAEARARPQPSNIQLDGVGGPVALWQAYARLEEKCKNLRSARRVYAEAVARFPSDVRLHCEYAKLELRLGNLKTARNLLSRAIEVDDGYPYAYQYLGLVEQADMRIDAARNIYSRGIERCSAANSESRYPIDTASLYHSWALMEWKCGDVTSARNLFERGLKVDRSAGWLWASYARFEADLGNDDLAQHYYARAVNASPKDPAIWNSWAAFERRRCNQERADTYAKRALELRRFDQTRGMDPIRPLARRRFKA